MQWRVRVAGAQDLGEVVALARILPELPHWEAAQYAKYVAAEDGGGERLLVIAEAQAGELLGFAAAVWRPPPMDLVELESVGVAEAARRLGVASSLCGWALDWARRRGAAAMELEVRSGSAGARALYRSLGFVPVGNRVGYYRDPLEDAVLMSKRFDDGQTTK